MMIYTPRNLLVENKLRVCLRPKHPRPRRHTQCPLPFATGGPSFPSSSDPLDLTSWDAGQDNTSWEEGTQNPSRPPSSWNSYDQSGSTSGSGRLPFVAAITGVALFSFFLGRQLTNYREHHNREDPPKHPLPLESALADIPNNNNNNDYDYYNIDRSHAEDQKAISREEGNMDNNDNDDADSSREMKMAHSGLHLEKEYKQAMMESPQQPPPPPSSSLKTAGGGHTELQPQQEQRQEEGDLHAMEGGGVMQDETYQENLHAMDQDITPTTTTTSAGFDDDYSGSSSSKRQYNDGRLPLRSPEAEQAMQKAQEKQIRRLYLYDRLEGKQEGGESVRTITSAGAGQVGKEKEREEEELELNANEDEAKEVQALARGMSFEALQNRANAALTAATKASVAAKRASESAALSTDAAAQSAFAARRAMRASARAAGALEIRSQEQVQAAYKEAKEAEKASEQAAQSAAVSAAHVLMSERDAKSSSRVATAAADMSGPHGVVEKIHFQWMKLRHAGNMVVERVTQAVNASIQAVKLTWQCICDSIASVWNFVCRKVRKSGGENGGSGSKEGEQGQILEELVVDNSNNNKIKNASTGKKGKGGNKGGNDKDEEMVVTTKKRRRWLRVR